MGERVGLHSQGMLVQPQLSLMFTVEDNSVQQKYEVFLFYLTFI